jgi:hypothetical protein
MRPWCDLERSFVSGSDVRVLRSFSTFPVLGGWARAPQTSRLPNTFKSLSMFSGLSKIFVNFYDAYSSHPPNWFPITK